jgi:hypothetical protein
MISEIPLIQRDFLFFLTPKKVRPALGGRLAARGPVWDGEGWGRDRLA